MAVVGGVFNCVFLCCPFSPLDVLDEIWDLIESVSEEFLTYFFILKEFLYFVGKFDAKFNKYS